MHRPKRPGRRLRHSTRLPPAARKHHNVNGLAYGLTPFLRSCLQRGIIDKQRGIIDKNGIRAIFTLACVCTSHRVFSGRGPLGLWLRLWRPNFLMRVNLPRWVWRKRGRHLARCGDWGEGVALGDDESRLDGLRLWSGFSRGYCAGEENDGTSQRKA